MNPTDSFGLISIGKYATDHEIELEEKSSNTYIKKILIKSMQEEEFFMINSKPRASKLAQLEIALEKAYSW